MSSNVSANEPGSEGVLIALQVRHQGWGVSIHSTLTTWEAHILPEVYDRVCEAQVNPAVGRTEVREVPWINGLTGKVEQSVPKSKRLRLRRDGIRTALVQSLDIKIMGQRLVNIEKVDGGVRAEFTDGSTVLGTALVGADVGCALMMSEEQVNYFKDHVDPLCFMGTHPETNTFVFWSLLDTPTFPGMPYRAQLYFSWMACDADEELFQQPLLDVFRQKGRPFFPRLRVIVDALPDDRGEGVNHAIVNACQFADTIKAAADGQVPMADAIREYERQMRPRAKEAVETSREAGHDGHCYAKIDKEGSLALLGEKPV
ncbi:uncharacterized protein BDW70DRAFT_162374 [Aspergillus foveolatus]|uniref:uncharacterized protein n=1 Tax=Aspergillus foveolatus TaxID=210207 RepID=UPI003CCDB2B6